MVALFKSAGGDNWINRENWLSDAPIGEWHGVTTDSGGRITELRLGDNQLTGKIPS